MWNNCDIPTGKEFQNRPLYLSTPVYLSLRYKSTSEAPLRLKEIFLRCPLTDFTYYILIAPLKLQQQNIYIKTGAGYFKTSTLSLQKFHIYHKHNCSNQPMNNSALNLVIVSTIVFYSKRYWNNLLTWDSPTNHSSVFKALLSTSLHNGDHKIQC